jgi:pimeloyl-ACP methyl ester carboxylesterase
MEPSVSKRATTAPPGRVRRGVCAGVGLAWLLLRASLLLGLASASVSHASETEAVPDSERETVVLLHGLGRSSFSMQSLAAKLEAAGYLTHNIDYPSTNLEADELGGMLGERLDACCRDAARLHFVTHSMGGIVVRAYLAEHRPENLGRVVMLAPPNRGSEWVDFLGDVAVFRWVMGPTAAQLGTDDASLPNRLPKPDYPLGIIAGTGVVNPVGAGIIPGDDDGTVSVERTRLDGMTDFVTVDASHSFIMYSDDVAREVIAFLTTGQFDHRSDSTDANGSGAGEDPSQEEPPEAGAAAD